MSFQNYIYIIFFPLSFMFEIKEENYPLHYHTTTMISLCNHYDIIMQSLCRRHDTHPLTQLFYLFLIFRHQPPHHNLTIMLYMYSRNDWCSEFWLGKRCPRNVTEHSAQHYGTFFLLCAHHLRPHPTLLLHAIYATSDPTPTHYLRDIRPPSAHYLRDMRPPSAHHAAMHSAMHSAILHKKI